MKWVFRIIAEEPNEMGLPRKGRAAEGASFPDTSGKRDDPKLVRTQEPRRFLTRAQIPKPGCIILFKYNHSGSVSQSENTFNG